MFLTRISNFFIRCYRTPPAWFKERVSPLDFLFFFFVLVSFFLRLTGLDYPLDEGHGEYTMAYLYAHHIVAHQDFLLAGDGNSVWPSLKTSPLYYYLLAAFLFIKDGVIFLGFINVLFQVGTLVLVYLLARMLFGTGTALIASILFGISDEILRQSIYVWHPWVMQLFANGSYVLLVLGYLKKTYVPVLLSIFFLIFAAALHSSAFSLVPLFMVGTFFILKQQRRNPRYYLLSLGTLGASLLVFFTPVLIYWRKFNVNPFVISKGEAEYISSFHGFFQNFVQNLSTVITHFFRGVGDNIFSPEGVVFLVTLFSIPLSLFLHKGERQRKIFFLLLLLFFLQPFLFASLIDKINIDGGNFYVYHFTAVFGLFFILVAEAINSVFSKSTVLQMGKILIVILLVSILSLQFSAVQKRIEFSHFQNFSLINSLAKAMEDEIVTIQKREEREDIDFFQLRLYRKSVRYQRDDAAFWIPLERDFQRKFVEVKARPQKAYFMYRYTNSADYIFLICKNYAPGQDKECHENFSGENPGYIIDRQIVARGPYIIYETYRQ